MYSYKIVNGLRHTASSDCGELLAQADDDATTLNSVMYPLAVKGTQNADLIRVYNTDNIQYY